LEELELLVDLFYHFSLVSQRTTSQTVKQEEFSPILYLASSELFVHSWLSKIWRMKLPKREYLTRSMK